jgi:hypothetical protein
MNWVVKIISNDTINRIGYFLGSLTLMILLIIVVFGGLSFVVEHFFIDDFISSGLVNSAEEFREGSISIAVALLIPPLLLNGFHELPTHAQDNVKILGLSIASVIGVFGYGAVFAMGFYSLSSQF